MPQNQIRFGLMPVLDVALELPRTALPLKSVRYRFVARGGLAEVEMTQVYCQENVQPLDCEYLFPLPADGAVHRCEAIINGRVIRARIEDREAARKIVEEKKAEGRRTAQVESERDNLFTLSLGNIQPQDVVEVKLAYLQPLRRLASQMALDLPLCPGVRYIPGHTLLRSNRGSGVVDDTDQVPDASRITPPRIDAEHPDAAFIELDGQVEAGFLDGEVNSPSHKLATTRNGDALHLTLAQGGEVPDRDLALRWRERAAAQTALRGWTSQDNGDNYALLELRAPDSLEPTAAVAQDVYFLVDRSGSMKGVKWQKAIQALHGCIGVLSPKDRVAVTLFESTFNDFDAEPVSPTVLMADPRFCRLASVGAAGGTEMAPALRHVLGLVERFSKDHPAVLVLITDAEIGNEREIIALMRQHPSLPVHCFGIDTTLNDFLLLDLVRQQGGNFLALQPRDDVAAIVTKLGRTLRQPVLVNLHAPVGWELAAGAIPNLYAGQVQLVSLRSKGTSRVNGLTVMARDHRNHPVSLEFHLASVPEAGPRLRWCKERLVTLVAQNDKAAALVLSKESNLLCPLTAFMAWDEQEKVEVAAHRLVQPAMVPDGAIPRRVTASMKMACLSAVGPADGSPPSRTTLHEEDRAMFCMELSSPRGKDIATARKLIHLNRRIRALISALGQTADHDDCVKSLVAFQDWVQLIEDGDRLDLVSRLLNDCEQDLKKREACEQRLRTLTAMLADELEQAASVLRNLWSQRPAQPPISQQLQKALARGNSGSIRQEINGTIAEMARLDFEIRKQIEGFLRQQAGPPA